MMLRSLLMAALLSSCAPPPVPVRDAGQPVASPQCRNPGPDPVIPKTAPPNSTYLTDVAPPLRYRAPVSAVNIDFMSKAEADRVCAGGVRVCGRIFYACASGRHLNMPNPCDYPMTDDYAKLLCHELAHINGWPASHGL